MTDLEMTKACAKAMRLSVILQKRADIGTAKDASYFRFPDGPSYDPLHDDAQAMALVKKFRLTVVWTDARLDGWRVRGWHTGKTGALCEEADADDLNRAIVECVSKMAAKQPLQGTVK